jgi:DNA-binding response OmpR family regulator
MVSFVCSGLLRTGRTLLASILLVDDHDDLLTILHEAVTSAGHQVECVRTLATAERAFASNRHDLVVTDLVLPDGCGYALAERVRADGRRAVLISGYPDEEARGFPGAANCCDLPHLHKPFRLQDLLNVIDAPAVV